MKVAQIVTTSDGKKFTGEDALAKGQAHEDALKISALFTRWADKKGIADGKTGRRKVSLGLIAMWEASSASGELAELEAELEAEAAEAEAAEAAAA